MSTLILVLLILFALIGAPLFSVFGAAALLFFAQQGTITSVAVDVFGERFADSPTLVTLPLFTFTGYLLAESGAPKRLVRVSSALFGWLPGGLAVVCLCVSAFFTSFTGGSGITIIAIGGLLLPALTGEKYSEKFSLGLVTTGGSLGILFPPSIPIVLYGIVAGVLIDKLFLAGLIPGIITVAILVAYSFAVGFKRRAPAAQAWAGFRQFLRWLSGFAAMQLVSSAVLVVALVIWPSWRPWAAEHLRLLLMPSLILAFFAAMFATSGETRAALRAALWELLLPFVLLAGLAAGALRIHEAAAFTALYVLVVEVFVYQDIGLRRDLPRVVRESMTLLGAILIILATALGFTAYLVQIDLPGLLVRWMDQYIDSPLMFLLVLNVFLLVVGMLMDIFSAIIVVVPLIIPIARHFGIDEYHLGIVFLLNLEIGYLMPPVGLNLFISSFRFKQPISKLYWAVLPFIGLLLIALLLTTYVPALSTSLTHLGGSGNEVDPHEMEAPIDLEDLGDDPSSR